MPLLSVVIPVRDEAEHLGAQLDALLDQPGDIEVLVCDNGSTDGTTQLVLQRAVADPRVRLVDASTQLGSGFARNCGARAAATDKLAFCDADDVVSSTWVAALTAALDEADFVTGPIELDRLNRPDVVRSRGRWLAQDGVASFDRMFPFASGCNMAIRRSAFESVSGFDPGFRYGQDIELSLRLWLAGYSLVFASAGLVHYRYRSTLKGMWRQGRNHGSSRPHLYRRIREQAPGTAGWHVAWRSWLWLVRHLPDLRRADRRARWLWLAGSKAGHVENSLRARVLCI